MTIEQKAQRYDEALKRAKKLYERGTTTESLGHIFPELKESEDERIKKSLCKAIWTYVPTEEGQEYIAWLEKQGEQKPFDYENANIQQKDFASKPKFKVGDFIVNDYCMGKVIELTNDAYLLDTGQGIPFSCEHNAHLWTIQDAKGGDVLYSPCLGILWIFKSRDTVYCGCNLNYNNGSFRGEGHFERPTDAVPATKEQRYLLFQKMHEAGYEWDAEKKELKKIEQPKLTEFEDAIKDMMDDYRDAIDDNAATVEEVKEKAAYLLSLIHQKSAKWSEEDEYTLGETIQHLEELIRIDKAKHCACDVQYYQRDVDWLKSLKDRYTWKPSDEQMKTLKEACDEHWNPDGLDPLYTLYQDLKKLREE